MHDGCTGLLRTALALSHLLLQLLWAPVPSSSHLIFFLYILQLWDIFLLVSRPVLQIWAFQTWFSQGVLLFLLLELLFSRFLWYILQFPLEKTIFSKSAIPVPLFYSFCGEIMKCLIHASTFVSLSRSGYRTSYSCTNSILGQNPQLAYLGKTTVAAWRKYSLHN